MSKNNFTQGEGSDTSVRELKWMAEFLAKHGQPKKALEIYRALVESMSIDKSHKAKPTADESRDKAA
jgi:hypothetical protein